MKIDVQWAELLQLMISILPQPGSQCQSDPIIHSEMFSFPLSHPGCLLPSGRQSGALPQELSTMSRHPGWM